MTAKEAWEVIDEILYQTDGGEYAANAGYEGYEEAVEVIDQLINSTGKSYD